MRLHPRVRAGLSLPLSVFLLTAASFQTAAATTINIINQDGAGEGFNDPTVVAPIGGNSGTTRGQQRLLVFQRAATIWAGIINSPVTINVQAAFNPLTCTMTSAVLGSAGAVTIDRDFSGAIYTGTWYSQALANKLAGSDLAPANNDINAQFNSSIDSGCFGSSVWYYGFDHNEGANIDLLAVVLHELGHGLGFQTFTSTSTGVQQMGFPDQWSRWLFSESTGKHWIDMSDAERQASAINTGNLSWDGPEVFFAAPSKLGKRPRLFVNAPGIIAGTYSVGTASFGGALTVGGVAGNVVIADDGVAPTSDACNALVNGAAMNGKIAFIDRGVCGFAAKAKVAQDAGAIAVIIANNVSGQAPGLGGTDPTVVIPVVSLSQNDGNVLRAQLGAGLNVTIGLDPTKLAGASDAGRPLMYAPNPVAPGSSVSHWDISATPNLLMEPNINADLTDNIDLMHDLFADIGWLPHTTSVPPGGPVAVALRGNAPNPFTPLTTIRYDLATAGETELDVYDLGGRLVKHLIDGQQPAGSHAVVWNGTDANGRRMAPGVYLYRLKAGSHSESKQMILIN
jgi:PA domain/FlgD Ig-like domain